MTVDDSHPKPVQTTGVCFGGLIGPDTFLTNRHCIPEDLRATDQSCENRMRVIFPKLSPETEVELGECEKIISVAPPIEGLVDENLQPDWAIIKLKESRPDRATEIVPMPIPDNTELFAFVSLQDPETEQLSLQQIKCTSRQKTLNLPEYSSDESPLVLLDCEQDITKGFSGSHLYQQVDENWQPVALLSHVFDTQINQEDIIVSSTIVATSLYCLPGDEDRPEACTFDPNQNQSLKDQLVIEALAVEKEEIQEQVARILGNSHPLQWQEVTVEKVENGESTTHMSQKWQNLVGLHQPSVGRSGRIAFFETMITQAPHCLKRDSIPDPINEQFTRTRVPVVRLWLTLTEAGRVQVHHQVLPQGVEIYENPVSPGEYLMGAQHRVGPRASMPQSLIANGVNFAATSLAVCE